MLKFGFVCAILCLLTNSTVLAQTSTTLRVITHDSFNVSAAVLEAFETETGITVEILRSGDAGSMLNQALLTKDNPLGDVIFGVDNTFLSRALNEDLFIRYESPLLEYVPEEFLLDEQFRVTPVDFGDVCINYDIAYFDENNLALPNSLQALIEPIYRGLLVVQNPATSSPGLAFLLATIAEFGTEGDYTYLDYWADLAANAVKVTENWETAYFSDFTVGGGGIYPMVVSYASSPPFTYDETLDATTTASLVADGMCFRQIEFVGIVNGTENIEAAQQFVDFIVSVPFQEDLPLQMFVFPVNRDAVLPELFIEYAQIPENPVQLDYAEIDANREEWIQAWTEVVLR